MVRAANYSVETKYRFLNELTYNRRETGEKEAIKMILYIKGVWTVQFYLMRNEIAKFVFRGLGGDRIVGTRVDVG